MDKFKFIIINSDDTDLEAEKKIILYRIMVGLKVGLLKPDLIPQKLFNSYIWTSIETVLSS